MMIRNKEQWKEAIENQKSSGLTIKEYCKNNHICISSFYKQKALLLKEEFSFLPVIVKQDNELIDFRIDDHHILCSKEDLKTILENIL